MQKQLVVQLARFGDILQTKRLILSLQQSGTIALCVDNSQLPLAKLVYPNIEIIPLQAYKAKADTVFYENKTIFDSLKKEKYDTIYTLNHSGLTQALVRLFEPSQVRGYLCDKGQDKRSQWVRFAFRYMKNRRQSPLHITDYWASLADKPTEPQNVNPSALNKMNAWQSGETKGKKFKVGIVLAGRQARRSLSPSILAPLIRVLNDRLNNADFLLLGSESEYTQAKELLPKIHPSMAKNIQNLTGKTTITELFDIIQECDLIVSPDTGTLHCAAFLGIPTLGTFCSSAWCFETGAYGLGHVAIQSTKACAPCAESSPCEYAKCRESFNSPALLARLAKKKTNKILEEITLCTSSFDDFGINYTYQNQEFNRTQAENTKKLLYEYRFQNRVQSQTQELYDTANLLFDETDYFFPHNAP